MVEPTTFVRVRVRCQCAHPRLYSVDVARVLLEASQAPIDPDTPVLSFRCRGCGVIHATWLMVVRAARKAAAA